MFLLSKASEAKRRAGYYFKNLFRDYSTVRKILTMEFY